LPLFQFRGKICSKFQNTGFIQRDWFFDLNSPPVGYWGCILCERRTFSRLLTKPRPLPWEMLPTPCKKNNE
jgi:hypothetical protein